jgi:hypothetical protein
MSVEAFMNSLMGTDTAQLSIVLLSVAIGVAVLAAISGLFIAWRKRSLIDEEPLPHCDLQQRLAQITHATDAQAPKTV